MHLPTSSFQNLQSFRTIKRDFWGIFLLIKSNNVRFWSNWVENYNFSRFVIQGGTIHGSLSHLLLSLSRLRSTTELESHRPNIVINPKISDEMKLIEKFIEVHSNVRSGHVLHKYVYAKTDCSKKKQEKVFVIAVAFFPLSYITENKLWKSDAVNRFL